MYTRRQMATFFAALNEQVAPGFANQPIVNTMMGPFTFNPATQSWTNVNNGMRISNAEFQNMMSSAGDYNTTSSDSTPPIVVVTGWQISNFTISPLTINGLTLTSNVYTGSTAQSNTLTISGNTTATRFKLLQVTGDNTRFLNDFTLTYSRNSGNQQNYEPLTTLDDSGIIPAFPPGSAFASTNTLVFRATAKSWVIGSATYGFGLYNILDGNTACSNTFYISTNIGACASSTTVSSALGLIDGTNMTAAGTTYFVNPTSAGTPQGMLPKSLSTYGQLVNSGNTISSPGPIVNINTTGNNVQMNLRAVVTNVAGANLTGIYGGTSGTNNESGINAVSSYNNMLGAGVTVGFIVNDGLTSQAAPFWLAVKTPGVTSGVGSTGSGKIQIINQTAGNSFSTAIDYAFDNRYVAVLTPTSFGSMTGGSQNTQIFASNAGAGGVPVIDDATGVAISGLANNTEFKFTIFRDTLSDSFANGVYYNIDGKAQNFIDLRGQSGDNNLDSLTRTVSTTLGVSPNNTIKIGLLRGSGPGNGYLQILNDNAFQYIDTIRYQFT